MTRWVGDDCLTTCDAIRQLHDWNMKPTWLTTLVIYQVCGRPYPVMTRTMYHEQRMLQSPSEPTCLINCLKKAKTEFVQDVCNQYMCFSPKQYVKLVAFKLRIIDVLLNFFDVLCNYVLKQLCALVEKIVCYCLPIVCFCPVPQTRRLLAQLVIEL